MEVVLGVEVVGMMASINRVVGQEALGEEEEVAALKDTDIKEKIR